MLFKKRAVRLLGEGPPRGDIARLRHGERRVDGIDTAHEIGMLGCGDEGRELLAAEREKHTPRLVAKRIDRVLHCSDLDPIVAGLPLLQAERLSASNGTPAISARGRGIGGNDGRKGVGRVDQRIDAFSAKIRSEALSAAEAAAPDRHGLRQWLGRAACERQRHGKIVALRQFFRERPRFGRAAEDKDMS